MSTTTNDKTVNKVALCSAIFAGFAYVGYAVVKTAFGKKGKHGDDPDGGQRIYFRRLSQTTQTDVLLGNVDITGSGKVVLRSVTVQERIRELNLRARMFADTMLAIQTAGNTPRHHRMVTKSLQGSPWSSPRILSPVDVQHILNSRSTEHLHLLTDDLDLSTTSSPIKRRWARRSFYKKSQNKSNPNDNNGSSPERRNYEKASQEAEKLFHQEERMLEAKLDELLKKTGQVITPFEAKCLTALMFSKDEMILIKTLIAIGNLGTFEENQNTFTEAGCLIKLSKLVSSPNKGIMKNAIMTIGNLILNKVIQEQLKDVVPTLTTMLKQDHTTDDLHHSIYTVLANFTMLPDHHNLFYAVMPIAYQAVDNAAPDIKLQALRLLINLSTNEDMIPSLLAAQAPRRLLYLLNGSVEEDILLRLVTLLSNLTEMVKTLNIQPTIDLPVEDKAASPETIRYAAIYGVNVEERFRTKISFLMNHHKNDEIRNHCKKIYAAITPAL